MATNWFPRTSFEKPRQWLLGNGEIVTEPALEQSPSGVKVRIPGTNISAYAKDMDNLVLKGVQAIATRKQTCVWMSLHRVDEVRQGFLGYDPGNARAELYVLKPEKGAKTIAWWKFKHPTLPIEAVLTVRAGREYQRDNSDHLLSADLVWPRMDPHVAVEAVFLKATEGTFLAQTQAMSLNDGGLHRTKMLEFIRDNPPSWPARQILGASRHGAERGLVHALLEKIRECEALDTIQVPDPRDPGNPAWLDLELYETNVNSNLVGDLAEYLEGTPTVTEALRIYEELRSCLRQIGWVMDERTENDFQRALLSGDPDGVTVNIGNPHLEGGTVDYGHALSMHLPTGTFVVSCGVSAHSQNEVAERWDEARAIASLTGEEDTLLAFAQEYVRRGHQKRKKAVIKDRSAQRPS